MHTVCTQGSHAVGKSGKSRENQNYFSRPGKSREFCVFIKKY
jgi:hypothetical protein